jgi:G3E family GTPase
MAPLVPLSVIGGFLGAGKTTLLNNLLRQAGGVRYAVLVNDFGDLAIDGDLIVEHGGDTITLANGCICCSLGDDLLITVMRLMQGADKPEHLLVEASGVADPRPIAEVAILHPELTPDATIVLADAAEIRERAADPRLSDTVERQFKAADVVLLNKCDLVDAAARAELRAWLAELAPEAALVETEYAAAPLALLLGRGLEKVPQGGHHHEPEHPFASVELTWHGGLDETRFRTALAELPAGVLRGKGIVRFAPAPERPRLVQLVGRRLQIGEAANAAAGSRLVLLGTLDENQRQRITTLFEGLASGD